MSTISKRLSKPGSKSSKSGSKSSKQGSKNDSNLSSADNDDDGWNAWEWSAQWQREWRSREMPGGSWEYQYRQLYPDDNHPSSPFIGTGDSPATIGEDVVSEPDFTYSLQPPSALHPQSAEEFENLQISRGSRTGGGSSYRQSLVDDEGIPIRQSNPLLSAQEEEDTYDDDTVATTNQTQFSCSSNLQRVQNSQQDIGLSYSTGIPSMSKSTNKPLPRSIRHQNTEGKGDYSGDDTDGASAEEFENLQPSRGSRTGGGSSYSMVDNEGIPIRQSNPTRTPLFTSPYSRSGNSNVPFAPKNTERPFMAMSPSSKQAPPLENTHIEGIATVAEDSISLQEAGLYGSFRVHPAKDFEFGKVFKILWTEPKGQKKAAKGTEIVPIIYGEQFYTSIRRFVIINPMQGHCLCLGQGTAKAGGKAQDHAIIYTKGKKSEVPKETQFEEKLLNKAIRMEPRKQRDQLAPTSRLNYAKIYTVEYNVKVSFIGKIHEGSINTFIQDFNRMHTLLPESKSVDGKEVQDHRSQLPKESRRSKNLLDQNNADAQDSFHSYSGTADIANVPDLVTRQNPNSGLLSGNKQENPYHLDQKSFKKAELRSSSSSVGPDDDDSVSMRSDTASSATSVDADPLGKLLVILFEDQRLSVLFSKARQIVLPDHFEKAMRRQLLKFARNLRLEAKSDIEREASRVIRYQSRNIASSLGKKIYPIRALNLDNPFFYQPLDLEKWRETIQNDETEEDVPNPYEKVDEDYQQETDSEKEGGEGNEEMRDHGNLQLHMLETFIKPSEALSSLASDFSLFLEASEAEFCTTQAKISQEDYDWTYEKLPDRNSRTTRRTVFNPAYKALSSLWPEGMEHSSIVSVEYKVSWEVPQFLASYFEKGQLLGNILTLTGDANQAQALSCSEYLKSNWPGISDPLLAATEDLVSTSTQGYVETHNLKIAAYFVPISGGNSSTIGSSAIFTVDAIFEDHHDIVSALSWMCAALRHGDTEGLSVSKAYIETTALSVATPQLLIKLCPLAPVEDNGACWHPLFAHTVIAYDFQISHRKKGRGLELSFQNMLTLTRSLYLTLYDSGLVAEGLDTLLIPIKDLKEDEGIQWHLEWKSDYRHEGSAISVSEILQRFELQNRYSGDDPQLLAGKRTFLGWTDEAIVTLGTEKFPHDPKCIGRSGAPVLRNIGCRRKTWSIMLGTNLVPGVNLQAEVVMEQAFDGNFTATRRYENNFRDRLQDSARRNAIISNWSDQISWYLPETSIILHMIHLYIDLRSYKVLSAEHETSPTNLSDLYAREHSDGGAAAKDTLENCMKWRLSAGDTVFRMDDLIGKYLLEFEQQRQELPKVFKTARELKNAPPEFIVGYELLDVVQLLGNRHAKVIKLSRPQPWTYLAEEAPVLFVKDLHQAIVPHRPNNLCQFWREVPRGKDYLAAAAPAIRYLIEGRGGIKLSDQISWDISSPLINSHAIGSQSTVYHPQKLHAVERTFLGLRSEQQEDPIPLLNEVRNGALIFGPPVLTKPCVATISCTEIQTSVEIHADEEENPENIAVAAQLTAQTGPSA